MRFSARLAVRAATLSGLICAAVSTVSPQALAASAASCRTGHGGLPFLLTAGGHGARVSGSVLALTPGTTVTIASSGGGGARAAHNGVHPGQALLRFCVQPARLARGSTLLTMAPSGVSVVVTHGRALALSHAAGGHVRVTGAAALRGRAQLVEVLLDRRRQRASLLVDGGRRVSLPATIPATTRISIGTPGRPSGSGVVAVPAGAVPSATTTAPTTSPAAPAGAPTTVPSGTGSAATTPALTTPPAPPHATPSTPATTAAPPASTETATTTVGPPILPPPGDTTTTQGVAQASNVPYNPFSPTSFWNAPTAPLDAVDPQSQTYVDDLLSQINSFGVYMNTTSYSAPVYVVPGDQPTVPVALTVSAPDLQQEFNAVPIPPGAKPAAGSDAHLTVWQPSTDKLWEFWKLGQTSRGGWTARWGGEMNDVSTNPGYFDHDGITNDWGATATSLPLLGGLITFADLKRGYIDHALAIAVPEAEEGVFSWPAQRSDGRYTGGVALPEGIRFRLDPTINVASLGLPRLDAMLAQAAQTYGIVLRDQSGAVTLYAQDPTTAGANPWPAALNGGGVSTGTFLSRFPWSHLQAIRTQLTTTP